MTLKDVKIKAKNKLNVQIVSYGFGKAFTINREGKMKELFRKFRFLNQIYAFVLGYFWLPCPVCGNYFGGHECGGGGIPLSMGHGKMVCYRKECNEEGDRQWQKMGEETQFDYYPGIEKIRY
jgi:hypothetical protein